MSVLVERLLRSHQHPWALIRFLFVGGFMTLCYSVLAAIFSHLLGLQPSAASALSYGLCIPPTYLAQRQVTFRSDAPHRRAFLRYVLLQAPLFVSSAIWAQLLIAHWRWPATLAFLLIGPSHAIASFLVQKAWTFARR